MTLNLSHVFIWIVCWFPNQHLYLQLRPSPAPDNYEWNSSEMRTMTGPICSFVASFNCRSSFVMCYLDCRHLGKDFCLKSGEECICSTGEWEGEQEKKRRVDKKEMRSPCARGSGLTMLSLGNLLKKLKKKVSIWSANRHEMACLSSLLSSPAGGSSKAG